MKIAAIICNVILIAFTCLVLATDGLPQGAAFVILTLLVLLVPLFSTIVLARANIGAFPRSATIIGNSVLLGFVIWAIVSQYPHPKEDGVVAYSVLMVLTPLLNMAALFFAKRPVAPAP